MEKNPFRQYQKENDDFLKKSFAGWIKQNFLITVKNTFLNNPLFFEKILEKYQLFDMSIDHHVHRQNDLEFEICQFIVMFHLHNTFKLKESEIGKLQNDKDYIIKLCSQVYDAIAIKNYSLSYLNSNSIFEYYPLAYYCGVMTNFLSNCLNEKIALNEKIDKYNERIFIPSFSKILTKSLATCVLINANLFEETFSFIRYIIETLAIFVAINNYPDAIEFHNKLAIYRYERSINGEYPKEFLEDCSKYNIEQKQRNSFLNYGWLFAIPTFKSNKLSFDGVLDAIPPDTKELINLKEYFKKTYKQCGVFIHSTTIKHDNCSVMLNILQNLAYMLDITSEFFSDVFNLSYIVDGVNIKENFRKIYLESQYDENDLKSSKTAKKINELFLRPSFIK